jgi:pilus assembly protein Flp/PilA
VSQQGTNVRIIGRLSSDQRGGTVIEYGLICGLIVLAIMVSLQLFAGRAIDKLNFVANEVNGASQTGS